MQLPNEQTPIVKRCDLAQHAVRMLGKFTSNVVLIELATRLQDAGNALFSAQQAYEAAVRAILPTRVDVSYIDFMSDRLVRSVQQRAELADGKKGGRIATMVCPDGARAVTRLRGASQVEAMIDLEANLQAAQTLWPEAAALRAEVAQRREEYQAAIEGRRAAGRLARDLRVERDAEAERFLYTYAEVAALVKAQFPRDREMQDLFFDEVRSRSTREAAESDEALPEEEIAAPAPAPAPAPA